MWHDHNNVYTFNRMFHEINHSNPLLSHKHIEGGEEEYYEEEEVRGGSNN